jgi:hypothetical protein
MHTSDTPQEVLGPRLTKGEARPLENQAKRHYRAAGRNLAKFAADLRRLQDGQAHLTRGFSSFGAYAEHTFDQEDQHPRRRPAGARRPRPHRPG